MTTEEIKKKILEDDDFVVSELEKFLVYYNLKHTLRWGQDNKKVDETESVAEHIYGMHILADYFLPFYPKLDTEKVRQIITWHDMAEAVVDDMTTNSKTDTHRQAETEAEKQITKDAPLHIQELIGSLFYEYEEQESLESKFVKAIDKIEPMFHMYFIAKTTNIGKNIFADMENRWPTLKIYTEHRRTYIEKFDLIWRFDSVMTPVIDSAGFFREQA